MALRIVFMGTPVFAVPVLEAVLERGHHVAAVYSQPPRPAGRGMADTKSPVHVAADVRGIPVVTPLNFKDAGTRAAFAAHKADATVVVAYGLLLPADILNATRLGCFNVHASKLPRWRGAAPIQRAIMAGDRVTAVAIMRMEQGLDTGPVCLERDVEIPSDMTAGVLHDALAIAGAALMADALDRLEAGTLTETPQPQAGVTYAAKIDKAETRIDFTRLAVDIVNHIRGLSPAPGAWFETGGGKTERIKALTAAAVAGSGPPGTVLDDNLTIACGRDAIRLHTVQRAGKRPATAEEFLRGFQLPAGSRIS